MLLLLTLPAALAGPPTSLTWDLTLNGKLIGQRTLEMTTEDLGGVEMRTLQAETHVDARVFGIPFAYDQKLTANADVGPASFIGVTRQAGAVSEVQGRRSGGGWLLSVTSEDRTRSYDLDGDDVDLSTADLLDPRSHVPLSRFQTAKVLSVETGEVLTGAVEPLGPDEILIDGTAVPVEGYRWTTDQGPGTFWYTSEGWLVRFESKVLGQKVAGTLSKAPPSGPDDAPVDVFGPALQATDL